MLSKVHLKLLGNVLVIFVILCLNFFFLPLSGGENHYLQFAKQFADPNWIPNSFTLTEFPGTRLVFQYLFGWLFKYIEFDLCTLILRLFNFALVSIPLAQVFRHFQFKIFEWVLLLQLFLLPNQSLMAKEWMFGTFEPKTIAYAFILWAFLAWLNKKYYSTVIWVAIACYFHILVGAWFLVVVAIIALVRKNWKAWIKPALLFIALLSPYLIYLLPVYFSAEPVESTKPLDYIYVYYRLSHHLGLFKSIPYFLDTHLSGVMLTAICFGLCFYFYKKEKYTSKDLPLWISICFAICLFFTFVAYLDFALLDRSGGLGLKYYPFRMNSFGYFLLFIMVFSFFKRKNYFNLNIKVVTVFFILITLGTAISRTYYGIGKDWAFTSDKDYWDLLRYLNSANDHNGSYILAWEDYNKDQYFNFSRLTGLENFSVYKFVPAEKKKLAEWYERQMDLKKLRQEKATFDEICTKYGLTHVISEELIEEPMFSKIYENPTYFIYKHTPLE